jgi:hypothetical protein
LRRNDEKLPYGPPFVNFTVMAMLGTAIHGCGDEIKVDARIKSGHDDEWWWG